MRDAPIPPLAPPWPHLRRHRLDGRNCRRDDRAHCRHAGHCVHDRRDGGTTGACHQCSLTGRARQRGDGARRRTVDACSRRPTSGNTTGRRRMARCSSRTRPRAPGGSSSRPRSSRVQALDSFPVPADQGLGPGHSLLITQAIVRRRSRIQWLLDGATSFTLASSYALPSAADAVRSFGAHESGRGVVGLRGRARPGSCAARGRGPGAPSCSGGTPELAAAPPRGRRSEDPEGHRLRGLRRRPLRHDQHQAVPPQRRRACLGTARWVLVYQEPPVGAFNSGLRGPELRLARRSHPRSCCRPRAAETYTGSTACRTGQLALALAPRPGRRLGGLTPVLEFAPVPSIAHDAGQRGHPVPASGNGSIGYVIAAYNDFDHGEDRRAVRQLFGFERRVPGQVPARVSVRPGRIRRGQFGASACFAVRTDDGVHLAGLYTAVCSGPDFTASGEAGNRHPRPGICIRSSYQALPVRRVASTTPATTATSTRRTAQRGPAPRPGAPSTSMPRRRERLHEGAWKHSW